MVASRLGVEIADGDFRAEINLRGGQVIAVTLTAAERDKVTSWLDDRWTNDRPPPAVFRAGDNSLIRAEAIDSITTYSSDAWNEQVRSANGSLADQLFGRRT